MGPAGPCRRGYLSGNSAGAARRVAPPFCLVRHTLRLARARAATAQAAALHPTDARSELACDAFRCGSCCTLLLYEALEPCGQIFELWSMIWCGAMGIRTPDLLHAMQVGQPACQGRYRPLPADLVHRRARESLPVAGRWLSTWLSATSLIATVRTPEGRLLGTRPGHNSDRDDGDIPVPGHQAHVTRVAGHDRDLLPGQC